MLGVNIQLLLKDNLSKEIMKTLNMTYGMHPVCGMVHMFPCGGGRPMSILECLKFSCMLQS